LAPTSFSPLKKTLSADIVCYVLRTCVIGLYTGEKKILSLLCMYRVSNQPEKHTTHTYTQKKKKKNFFLILYIFRWGWKKRMKLN
jgi:hypothetical protein